MNNIGAYLKELRKKSGLSLKEVHSKSGITDSKLSRIERNEGTPLSAAELRLLAELYDIEVVQLYIAMGYLNEEDLYAYTLVFRNSDLLTEEERHHIQEQIDLFIKGRKVTSNGI